MTKIRDTEQLIETAARIFGERGLENTSLDDIAAALGVKRNTLYYYAANKADLFVMVLIRRLTEIVDEIESIAASDEPPRKKLIAAMRAHMRHTDRYYPESRVWIAPVSALQFNGATDDPGMNLQDRLVEIFRSLIRELIQAGEVPPTYEPKVVALGLLGMCNWVTRWYRKDGGLSIDEIATILIDLATNGLTNGMAVAAPRLEDTTVPPGGG